MNCKPHASAHELHLRKAATHTTQASMGAHQEHTHACTCHAPAAAQRARRLPQKRDVPCARGADVSQPPKHTSALLARWSGKSDPRTPRPHGQFSGTPQSHASPQMREARGYSMISCSCRQATHPRRAQKCAPAATGSFHAHARTLSDPDAASGRPGGPGRGGKFEQHAPWRAEEPTQFRKNYK
jgi:hypothetical protein